MAARALAHQAEAITADGAVKQLLAVHVCTAAITAEQYQRFRAVAMLQEEHAEKDAIGVVLDVATKEYLRMPLVGPVGPSQQVQLTGQGSWRTGKFKSCDDVAAASSIRDQHPKGGVSP